MGFEGDAAYIDVIKMRLFVEANFNDTQLLEGYFNNTDDRLTAMKDFSRINVYVSDPEVQTPSPHEMNICCSTYFIVYLHVADGI